MEKKIENEVTTQIQSLLSDSSALDVLFELEKSLRVKKALENLRQTQSTLIELRRTLTGKQSTLIDAVAYLFWVEVSQI